MFHWWENLQDVGQKPSRSSFSNCGTLRFLSLPYLVVSGNAKRMLHIYTSGEISVSLLYLCRVAYAVTVFLAPLCWLVWWFLRSTSKHSISHCTNACSVQVSFVKMQSEQFIPKMFDGVEVRALCRPIKFFHTDWQTISVWATLYVGGIVILKKGKGLPQTVATKLEA